MSPNFVVVVVRSNLNRIERVFQQVDRRLPGRNGERISPLPESQGRETGLFLEELAESRLVGKSVTVGDLFYIRVRAFQPFFGIGTDEFGQQEMSRMPCCFLDDAREVSGGYVKPIRIEGEIAVRSVMFDREFLEEAEYFIRPFEVGSGQVVVAGDDIGELQQEKTAQVADDPWAVCAGEVLVAVKQRKCSPEGFVVLSGEADGGEIVRAEVFGVLVVKCPAVGQPVEVVGEDVETPEPEMCRRLFETSCHTGCKEDEVFCAQGMFSVGVGEQGGSAGDQQEEESPFQDKAGEAFQL